MADPLVSSSTVRSAELFARARELLPGGVDSPVRAFRGVGGTPLFIARGKGATIWDVDGNRYVDYLASWGPLIAGHAHPGVVAAIHEAPNRGTSFGANPRRTGARRARQASSSHYPPRPLRLLTTT